MCNSKTIRRIYNDFYLLEDMKMPKKYYKVSQRVDKLRKDIKMHFDSSDAETLLEQLGNAYIDMNCIDSEQSFVDGFCLATRIVTEAFLQEKKNANN